MKVVLKTAVTFLLTLTTITALAGTPSASKIAAYKKMLSSVPVLELPDAAAKEVAKAKPQEQEETALAVLRAAISIAPASRQAILAAISKVAPRYATTLAKSASPVVQTAAIPTPTTQPAPVVSGPTAPKSSTPIVGAPFVPDSGPTYNTGQGTPVTGGRNYSRPN